MIVRYTALKNRRNYSIETCHEAPQRSPHCSGLLDENDCLKFIEREYDIWNSRDSLPISAARGENVIHKPEHAIFNSRFA